MNTTNHTPRVCDNYRDEITVTIDGNEIRGWSYADEAERRVKMLAAREFCEGWFMATERSAALRNLEASDQSDEIICEACDKPCDLDTAVLSEDCWFCADCYAQFKADFNKCEHDWALHVGVNGDAGRVCTKCSGFVIDEETRP